MHLKILLLILVIFHQESLRVESLSISSAVQQKLDSITHWLDSVNDATIFDYIYRVNKGIGLNLFEGDIKGYNPKHSQLRTAITDRQQLWNTRVVPYVIDPNFDSASRKDIHAAFDEYHTKTCIRFVPRTTETDYVHIKQVSGCYSNVGRTGGGQEISLAGACLKKGTAVHELMHALGFWHEQSRPDRDSWVQVVTSNIQQGKGYNFEKLPASEVDTLGVQYDYGSVMHYSKYAFSKNGNPTIIPTRQTDAELGQRQGLSDRDVIRIRTLYRCDSSAQTTQAPTKKPTTPKPIKTDPPKTNPPPTNPPPTQPPATNPPITNPPRTNPPITNPPVTKPPATNQPQTNPPVTNPPQTNPPVTNQPPTIPPVTNPPKTNAPVTVPPVTQPPQTQKPVTNQPIYQPSWTMWSSWSVCNSQCHHSRYRFCLNYDSRYCPGVATEVAVCPFPCKPAVSLGCWTQDANNPSIPSAEGMSQDLMIPYKDRIRPFRACADYAAVRGYTAFALTDGGKCLTGPEAHKIFRQAGPSNMCGYKGTGSPQSMNVYSFEADIDGEWSLWTGWSHCTRSCGLGRQYRYRRCDNPPPVGKGATCPGDSEEVVVCNPAVCVAPVTCGNRFHVGSPGSSGLIWVRDYDNFMECEYQVATSDPLATISVLIHQMDVEYSRGCIYDSITLYDGPSYKSPMVGTYCGNQAPGRFESSANRLYIKFESDETNTGHGFTIFYTINSRSRKACVKPPQTAHLTMFMEGNLVGDKVWYQCEPGYTMAGQSPITCTDQPGFALWDGYYPRCVNMRKRSVGDIASQPCDFEQSLCGFTNDKDDDFDWMVHVPHNQNLNTSLQTGIGEMERIRGNYLQATSTRMQEPGDLAGVRSGFHGNADSMFCLIFMYKIDGGEMAELRMYANKSSGNNTSDSLDQPDKRLLWRMSGNDDNVWHKTNVLIEVPYSFEIVFEADIGTETGSSVAIDDVILSSGKC